MASDPLWSDEIKLPVAEAEGPSIFVKPVNASLPEGSGIIVAVVKGLVKRNWIGEERCSCGRYWCTGQFFGLNGASGAGRGRRSESKNVEIETAGGGELRHRRPGLVGQQTGGMVGGIVLQMGPRVGRHSPIALRHGLGEGQISQAQRMPWSLIMVKT